MKKYLFNLVESILKEDERARNDDKFLTIRVWEIELLGYRARSVLLSIRGVRISIDDLTAFDVLKCYGKNLLSDANSITRYRRILKEKYPPTKNTEEWRTEMVEKTKQDIKVLEQSI